MPVSEEMTGYITNVEWWGLIPSFFNPLDERPIAEQFDSGYISGFSNRKGDNWQVNHVDEIDKSTLVSLNYNETYDERGRMEFGPHIAILFDYAFVAARTGDGEWTVGRMD